jgi:hypothetical protein
MAEGVEKTQNGAGVFQLFSDFIIPPFGTNVPPVRDQVFGRPCALHTRELNDVGEA